MDAIGLHFFDCFYQCSLASKKNGEPRYSDRDRKILMETYGLADSEIHTMTEIALEFGLSRERIRQLHVKIFKKMGFLRRNSYPATIEIDNLISNGHSIDIECDEQLALYIEQFHKKHMLDFDFNLLLRLLSFYLYRNSERVGKWRSFIYQNRQTTQRKILKLNRKLEEFIENIIWCDDPKIWSKDEMRSCTPIRQLNPDDETKRSKQGEFFSKKLNRNVFYESLLEKHFYDFLEECPEVIYYVEQSQQVPYFIKTQMNYYIPDVTVFLNDGRCFVVEIKDIIGMVERKVHTKFKALIEYCKEKGMGAILTNGRDDFSKILFHKPNETLENALKEQLEKGSVFYPELRKVRTECNATIMDILRAIVSLNLSFFRAPFMVQKCNKSIFCEELIRLIDPEAEKVNS